MDSGSDTDRIQSFIAQGNYHAAFNIAVSALNECRRNGDQPGIDRFLGIIKGIALAMEKAFGSQ